MAAVPDRADAASARQRPRRKSLASWVACVAILAVGGIAAPPAPAGAAPPPLRFGTLVVAASGQTLDQRLTQLESTVGRQFTDIRIFKQWDDTWPDSFARNTAAGGRRIILSVKGIRSNGQRIPWSQVVSAQPGSSTYATMERWAVAMRDLGSPILFTFDHEPEAVSGAGTAAEYIAAYRRWVGVLESVGATNVDNVWILTAHAFKVGSRDRRQAVKWYPGDDVVDVIAADAYNFHTCRGKSEQWRSLETAITPMRNFGRAHPDKPLLLTEWGSVEDPANPNRKAQWFRDARALFKKPGWEQYVGVVYFNRRGKYQCNWSFDTSPTARQAFIEMAQDPYYGGPGSP